MTPELKQFIQDNRDLINQNSKESWEKIYKKFLNNSIKSEFTQTILDVGINDPAGIMRNIPNYYLYKSSINSYEIPDNVTSIGQWAFYNCNGLTSVEIPDNVTSVGSYAFSSCSSLTSVVIGDSVTTIGDRAFYSCSSLTSVVIQDGVTSIGEGAFCKCVGLTSVQIGKSVTSIGKHAFFNCTNLKKVVIGNNVTSIDEGAFRGCNDLTEIKFKGTRKEAISCGVGNSSKKSWRRYSSISKIICTDGIIEL